MTFKLCNINDIEDPGAKGFQFEPNNNDTNIFIVKKEGQIYGYKNKCPHAGVNLEWQADDFLDMDKNLIQCSVHGAVFIIESGLCAGGPCNGNNLQTVAIRVNDNGDIFLK
jgi:nitrite reductase/ring-hydroxylating ferredoxin subunit